MIYKIYLCQMLPLHMLVVEFLLVLPIPLVLLTLLVLQTSLVLWLTSSTVLAHPHHPPERPDLPPHFQTQAVVLENEEE